jgi:hypothetical protein
MVGDHRARTGMGSFGGDDAIGGFARTGDRFLRDHRHLGRQQGRHQLPVQAEWLDRHDAIQAARTAAMGCEQVGVVGKGVGDAPPALDGIILGLISAIATTSQSPLVA